MSRNGVYPILIAGAIILIASLGRPQWMSIGVAYLLAGGGVAWGEKTERSLRFTHALLVTVGVIIATVVGELIVQIRPFHPVPEYSVLSDPLLAEILLREALMPILVISVFVFAVASTRRQHVLTTFGVVGLIGWYLLEPISASMPYDNRGKITSPTTHLIHLLLGGYFINIVVYAGLFGLPLYLLVQGLPSPIDNWLTEPTDTPQR